MWTYTHGEAAFMLGLYLQKRQPVVLTCNSSAKVINEFAVPVFCSLGAMVSDLPLATQMVRNLCVGIKAEEYIPPLTHEAMEVAHSWPLWWLLLLLLWSAARKWPQLKEAVWPYWAKVFLWGGIVCHIPVDALTHGTAKLFHGDDYIWPFDLGLNIISKIGIWDYRRPHHTLVPKWQEVVIDLLLLGWIFGIYWLRRRQWHKKSIAQTNVLSLQLQA